MTFCPGCGLALNLDQPGHGESCFCPRCQTRLVKGKMLRFNTEIALSLACLTLFVPVLFMPLLTITLFGVKIPATLPDGALQLMLNGFPFVGALSMFCGVVAPVLYVITVLLTHLGLAMKVKRLFASGVRTLAFLKHWVMIDVYLISLAISCFKVRDYADIEFGIALYALIACQILLIILLSRTSIHRYWEQWQSVPKFTVLLPETLIQCHHCLAVQSQGKSHCHRCNQTLSHRQPQSLQRTWAYLIAATVFLLPANYYPISILITNGSRLEDTIFSGVLSLINSDMILIAIIIFTASILVPVAKIAILAFLLVSIHKQSKQGYKKRMALHRIVQWIGKWSIMDLFVISIMMTLLDRGQILDFTPGIGAIAFGIVVVLTMLAAESLDSRLLWDNYDNEQPT
ncbi:PqiA/YebS family transporter subunit [Thaumasiovibrio subtropicus]|uniref:PqiA/YebS family transporter subunit n=1 Tax=Thaumasiovibrio subtropicus TaxID=1891207 RepID=UPI0039C90D4B